MLTGWKAKFTRRGYSTGKFKELVQKFHKPQLSVACAFQDSTDYSYDRMLYFANCISDSLKATNVGQELARKETLS